MVSHLFDDIFNVTRNVNYPPVNAYNNDKGDIVIEAAVAGFTNDELDVTFEHGVLSLSGRKEDTEEREYILRGIATRSFNRTFNVRGSYEVDSAELEHGILTVVLKNVSVKKSIKIKTL